MKIASIVLDNSTEARLAAEANRSGLKRSEIVRRALNAHFDTIESKRRRRPTPASTVDASE